MISSRCATGASESIITKSRQVQTNPVPVEKDMSPVQSAKGLGEILAPNLYFDDHVTATASECIGRLAQINRVKHCLEKSSLLTVINTLVFSKMYYCSNVWVNTTDKNIRKFHSVQKFACRIVSGAGKYGHVTPLLKSLSWLPVKDRIYYRQPIYHGL